MAICYMRGQIIHGATDSSAVGISAYIRRESRTDHHTGKDHDFRLKPGYVDGGIIVPEGSPEWAQNGEALWNAAQEADMTVDRKTGEKRYCRNAGKDAQIAKHFVIALPAELSPELQKKLLLEFIEMQWGKAGIAVEWAIHEPDNDNDNWHAHVVVSTRYLTADGFGKKARELNPDFRTRKNVATGEIFRAMEDDDKWSLQWSNFQNHFFEVEGLDLRVDAQKVVAEPHLGKASKVEDSDLSAEAEDAKALARALVQAQPDLVIDKILEMSPSFSRRGLAAAISRGYDIHGSELEQLVNKAMSCGRVLELLDKDSGAPVGLYTTEDSRKRESLCMADVVQIDQQPRNIIPEPIIEKIIAELTFKDEQSAMLRHALSNRFSITQGDPGTGKSHAMKGLRIALEQSGKRVYGGAPQGSVASEMMVSGFAYAATLHRLVSDYKYGNIILCPDTALIIDEAAMADTATFGKITKMCADTGTELHIVGDDKQFSSVAAGGIYTELRRKHGEAALTDIVRQKGEMREASKDLAAGRIGLALKRYEKLGAIHFSDTSEEAAAELMKDYKLFTERDKKPAFVMAGLNVNVQKLNYEIQTWRISKGELGNAKMKVSRDGEIEVRIGDRIQTRQNDRKIGVTNGWLGTITRFNTDGSMLVRFDDGKSRDIPMSYTKWQLGYTSTVYKAQGATKPVVLQYRDNPMGGREFSLVAMTRHTDEFHCYVGRDVARDMNQLEKQVSRIDFKHASIHYDARAVETQTLDQEHETENQADLATARVIDPWDLSALDAAEIEAAFETAGPVEDLDEVEIQERAEQRRFEAFDRQYQQEQEAKAKAAFDSRTDELIKMMKDGRKIVVADAIRIDGMTDNTAILNELRERESLLSLAQDIAGMQREKEAADEKRRILEEGKKKVDLVKQAREDNIKKWTAKIKDGDCRIEAMKIDGTVKYIVLDAGNINHEVSLQPLIKKQYEIQTAKEEVFNKRTAELREFLKRDQLVIYIENGRYIVSGGYGVDVEARPFLNREVRNSYDRIADAAERARREMTRVKTHIKEKEQVAVPEIKRSNAPLGPVGMLHLLRKELAGKTDIEIHQYSKEAGENREYIKAWASAKVAAENGSSIDMMISRAGYYDKDANKTIAERMKALGESRAFNMKAPEDHARDYNEARDELDAINSTPGYVDVAERKKDLLVVIYAEANHFTYLKAAGDTKGLRLRPSYEDDIRDSQEIIRGERDRSRAADRGRGGR